MVRDIVIGGVSFRLNDEGTGHGILFVHGFPLNHTMWQAQIAEFSSTNRVLAPDLRGFGGSGGALDTMPMEQFADDLASILDAIGIEGAVTLCGLSMGGYAAWQFVQRHPARVSKLIVCDTKAAADTPDAAATRLKLAETVLTEGPEPVARAMMPKLFGPKTAELNPQVVESVREMVMTSSPAAIAGASRGMAERPDVTAWLPAIRVPTLVLCGEHDAITPAADMKAMAERIPHAKYVAIPDAGHMAPMEQPALVNDAIRQFLG
jgi:pimeloyl-ACP methyl ester carboxylesterase